MYLGLDDAGLHFSLVNQNFQLGDGGKMIINGPIGVSGVTKLSTFHLRALCSSSFTLFLRAEFCKQPHGTCCHGGARQQDCR